MTVIIEPLSEEQKITRCSGVPQILFYDEELVSGTKSFADVIKSVSLFSFEEDDTERLVSALQRCRSVYITHTWQMPPWCCSALFNVLFQKIQKKDPIPNFFVGFKMEYKKHMEYSDAQKAQSKAKELLSDVIPAMYRQGNHPEIASMFSKNVSTFFFTEQSGI